MKLLRVIRFDQSDDHVFSPAAKADEWAVSGAVVFRGIEQEAIAGKVRQTFANGFLGVPSMGRSTFASVAEIDEEQAEVVTMVLARGFIETFGAPSLDEALAAARDEVAFAAGLAGDKPINTVFTVRRVLDEGGEIREEYREIAPPTGEPLHTRIWDVADDGS
jgi:hypothetical protein